MNCKLCHKKKTLKNSHIVPEFFYRPYYDEKGRMIAMFDKKEKPGFIQKGIREKLLCGDCEQFLNDKYEKYFHLLWYAERKLPKIVEGYMYNIQNIDYSKFKLFLLSILWRASVADGDDFTQVMLGPHEEYIRQMLINQEAKGDMEYQIFSVLLYFTDTSKVCDDLIMSPIKSKFEGRPVYIFIFGGCAWHFIVASHPVGPPLNQITLSENGKISILARSVHDFQSVDTFVKDKVKTYKDKGWIKY